MNEFRSELNPPITCNNDSNCQHIDGTECNEEQKQCTCKKDFQATDGKKCYKGKYLSNNK